MAVRRRRTGESGRGLTTRGRCLLAGGLAAAICAVVLDERDLLRIGVFACVLPLLGFLFTAFRSTRVSAVHLVRPERLHPGWGGTVTLVLSNTGQGATPTIDLGEPPCPDLSAGLRQQVPSIRRGGTAGVSYPIRAARRGRFQLGPPTIRYADPFGMWEEHRTLHTGSEVLVLPTLVPLTGMPPGAGLRSAASGRAATGNVGGEPDVGVRPYRTGDDIRTIHWRASARHDDLVVRLEEPVSHGGTTLLLDHRQAGYAGTGADSGLEVAVTLTASIALHLLATDNEVLLTDHQGRQLAQGHDIADEVLAQLAVVEPAAAKPLAPPAVTRSGLLVAVIGELSEQDALTLASSRSRASSGLAFVVRSRGWRGDDGRMPATVLLLADAGWRTVTIDRGDDLAQAWRQACQTRARGLVS